MITSPSSRLLVAAAAAVVLAACGTGAADLSPAPAPPSSSVSVAVLDALRAEVGPAATQVGTAARQLAVVARRVRTDAAAAGMLTAPVDDLTAGVGDLRGLQAELKVLPALADAVDVLVVEGSTARDAAVSVRAGAAAHEAVAAEVNALVGRWDEGGSRAAQIDQLGDLETALRAIATRAPSGPQDCQTAEVQWAAAAGSAADTTATLIQHVVGFNGNSFDEVRLRERPLVGIDIPPAPTALTCPALGTLDESLERVAGRLGDVEIALNPPDLVE